MKHKHTVKKEEIVFDNFLTITKATIEETSMGGQSKEYSRLALMKPDAVSILIVNRETEKVVLVKQFRYPISSKVAEPIFEVPAGVVDEGEMPIAAAIRETEEECGYRIKPGNISLVNSFFSCPGFICERTFLYFAIVTNEDKVSIGGGLEEENEDIEIIEVSAGDFCTNMITDGKILDSKTLISAYFLQHMVLKEGLAGKKLA